MGLICWWVETHKEGRIWKDIFIENGERIGQTSVTMTFLYLGKLLCLLCYCAYDFLDIMTPVFRGAICQYFVNSLRPQQLLQCSCWSRFSSAFLNASLPILLLPGETELWTVLWMSAGACECHGHRWSELETMQRPPEGWRQLTTM